MNPVVQVVSVRDIGPRSDAAAQIVYCGRAWKGWPDHPLAIPKRDSLPNGDKDDEAKRRAVLATYRATLLAFDDLEPALARLWADTGCGKKSLGCACVGAPNSCHANVLAELLTERFGRKESA